MSDRKLVPDAKTILEQQRASDPKHSAWVSANAGSGKTTVLSRRVVRLLLNGTDPVRILCLTFTKAAAGEMSNRVFKILGNWATISQEDLIEELTQIEGKHPSQKQLDLARTLFARALETPGGLKIQTIHAFCEALLHQFPLEANIPGKFSVMDDSMQMSLMKEARRTVILDADANPVSEVGKAFATMMDVAGDAAIEKVFTAIISHRDRLADWLNTVGGPQEAARFAKGNFGFSDHDTTEGLAEHALKNVTITDAELEKMAALGRPLTKLTAIDKALSLRIDGYFSAIGPEAEVEARSQIFMTSGSPRKFGRFATKQVKEVFPDLQSQIEVEAEHLSKALLRIKTLRLIEQTTPLLVVAQAVINHYKTSKRKTALLDFDDLVSRTADLLTRKSARSWVLYKLDLGIDHILLDEAQDTSPRQWQIVSALVEEFFSGQSSRPANRTVFAVGDEKQSIYSFQGAEPASFIQQRKEYTSAARNVGKDMPNVRLGLSFRSTQDVLSAVDAVFDLPENSEGITFGDDRESHTAARQHDPGSIEVWPLQEADQADQAPDWSSPQDQNQSRHQAVILANRIADQIKTWCAGERMEASGKLINAGDILVLVRARDRFMTALNRALKDRGIPVAGADRLALTSHVAVKDLLALGQIMLTPDDDLSLACVLKSPLIGLSEEQLYTLARARLFDKYEVSLFDALETIAGDDTSSDQPAFARAFEKLRHWRDRADALPVYEFYARILGADHGRQDFYSRLGAEAEDVLDAFLDRTLAHEQNGMPGLQAFIESLSNDAPEIKREMDQAAGQVRVMTVHAAKGLEAPIVFLVDKCSPAFMPQHAPSLYGWAGSGEDEQGFLWVAKSEQHGDATLSLRDEAKRKAEQEYRRLLYVAMTRAEDRLIVCGYKSSNRKPPSLHWHGMVTVALEQTWTDVQQHDGTIIHRWTVAEDRRKPVLPPQHHDDEAGPVLISTNDLPGWIGHNLPRESALPRPLNPSGAQALIDEALVQEANTPSLLVRSDAGDVDDNPRKRGTALHRLLQVLPDKREETRWALAKNYLQKTLPDASSSTLENILDGLRTTFQSNRLAPYFDPETSRAEVPVMGRLDFASGPKPVSGTIDRLAVLDDHIMLLDYKTSSFASDKLEDVAPDYITQMALYRALVMKLYPNRPVRAMLVWSHAKPLPNGEVRVTELPPEALDKAFTKIAGL